MNSELNPGAEYGSLPFDRFALVSQPYSTICFQCTKSDEGALGLLQVSAAGSGAMEHPCQKVAVYEPCRSQREWSLVLP
jgi:hypothetical protein